MKIELIEIRKSQLQCSFIHNVCMPVKNAPFYHSTRSAKGTLPMGLGAQPSHPVQLALTRGRFLLLLVALWAFFL